MEILPKRLRSNRGFWVKRSDYFRLTKPVLGSDVLVRRFEVRTEMVNDRRI